MFYIARKRGYYTFLPLSQMLQNQVSWNFLFQKESRRMRMVPGTREHMNIPVMHPRVDIQYLDTLSGGQCSGQLFSH